MNGVTQKLLLNTCFVWGNICRDMKIYLGSDHAGFELKEKLKIYLIEQGYTVEDKGAFSFDSGDDYTDFVVPVAQAVAESSEKSRGTTKEVRGIIIGKSGQGEAMAANRIKGARAAVYYGPSYAKASEGKGNLEILKLSREHNDANILSLAAGFLSDEEVKEAVKSWLKTPFSNESRHARRIKKIDSWM